MAFTYEHYRPPYIGSIMDMMLHANDPTARAAEISGQAHAAAAQGIGQAVGALPGQLAQGQRQGVVDERNRLSLSQEQQAVRDDQLFRMALAKAEASGGDMRSAVEFLKQQGGAGINALQKLTGLAQAQQAEHDDKAGELGYRLKKGGDTLGALQQLLPEYVKDGSLSAADATHLTELAQTDPSKLPAVSSDLMAKSPKFRPMLDKVNWGKPGEVGFGLDNQPIPGMSIPEKKPDYTINGQRLSGQTNQPLGEPIPPQREPVPKGYQHVDKLLDGKPTTLLLDPTPGGKLYDLNGAPIENAATRVKPIPPASTIINPAAVADVKEAVAGMKDGTIPPMLPGRASKEYVATMAEAHRQHYDLQAAVTDWNATQKHIASMNGAQQLRLNQAINSLPEMLDKVDALAAQWKGGRFPILNKANLALAKNGAYGQEVASVASQLDAQIADVTADLGNVYMGGNSPTDHALKLAEKSLNGQWSEKVLHDMVTLARNNVTIRSNSIKHTGVAGASPNNPYAPPQAPETAPKSDPLGLFPKKP